MESNNSSSTPSFSYNTATVSSSDSPPPSQRNDDKGKQTCSNKSEANKNKNNKPDSSVLKPGNKGRSSRYHGVIKVEKKSGYRWQAKISEIYLGTFGTEKDAAEAYDIAAIRLKNLIPGTRELNFDLENYNTEEILKCSKIPIREGACKWIKELTVEQFLRKNKIEIVESNGEVGLVPFEAENQRVTNSEGFVYMDDNDDVAFPPIDEVSLWNNDECYSEPLMEHLVSRNDSLSDLEGLDSTEDIQMSFADKEEPQQPSGGSNQADK